jgi:hypothetical protein
VSVDYTAVVWRAVEVLTRISNFAASIHIHCIITSCIPARRLVRIWNGQLTRWAIHHLASLALLATSVFVDSGVALFAVAMKELYIFPVVVMVRTLHGGTNVVFCTA